MSETVEQIADRMTSDIYSGLTIKKGASPNHWLAETTYWHGTHGKALTTYRGVGDTILDAVLDLERRLKVDG